MKINSIPTASEYKKIAEENKNKRYEEIKKIVEENVLKAMEAFNGRGGDQIVISPEYYDISREKFYTMIKDMFEPLGYNVSENDTYRIIIIKWDLGE